MIRLFSGKILAHRIPISRNMHIARNNADAVS